MFAGFGCFPEGEVAGGVFLVLVQIDARAVFNAAQVLLAQLAVFGERCEPEIPRAVFSLVGCAGFGEFLDQSDHARDVFGGAGDDLGALDAKGVEVFKKSLFEAGGVIVDGNAGGGGVADDFVVNVGNVHDVADGDAEQLEGAAQDVNLEERAEVADVAVVVDRRAAGIHAQGYVPLGREFLDGSGKGVVEAERHHS